MRFYFPDSQDMISPTYDFVHDEYSPLRVRQRDDLYAHEGVKPLPYDGILVSKGIVDGSISGAGKYSSAQRARIYRLGVRRFFRLPDSVDTMGDNGAFAYVNEHEPPVTVTQVLDFYESCGFDSGVSVDHIVFGFEDDDMYSRPGARLSDEQAAWEERRQMTLDLAQSFLEEAGHRRMSMVPVGAAQGWSPGTYANSVERLQEMGYRRIALGGMVPLKTREIIAALKRVDEVRKPDTELHLLGIGRFDAMEEFAQLGVTSIDSTSAFRQAFMDDRNNYHTADGNYVAIRVPQVDGNARLKRAILAGRVSQAEAVAKERECLGTLRRYDSDTATLAEALSAVLNYDRLVRTEREREVRSYDAEYELMLARRPWKACHCSLCAEHGIEIAIFRGTERNKRRGFHNLAVLAQKMHKLPSRQSRAWRGAHG